VYVKMAVFFVHPIMAKPRSVKWSYMLVCNGLVCWSAMVLYAGRQEVFVKHPPVPYRGMHNHQGMPTKAMRLVSKCHLACCFSTPFFYMCMQ